MNVLAINDALSILTIFFTHTTIITPASILSYNIYFCKIFTFISFFFPGVSSWLMVFMNVERLFNIRFSKSNFLKSMKSKMWIIFFIYMYNFCAYFFYLIDNNLVLYFDEFTPNSTISVLYCQFSDVGYIVMDVIFIANTVIVPFLIMTCCSIMLIKHIYETRRGNRIKIDQKKAKKDFRFSVIIISLNILFFVFNTPYLIINILDFIPNSFDSFLMYFITYDLLFEFYYLQFVFNLVIYLSVYTRFRKVFFHLVFRSSI